MAIRVPFASIDRELGKKILEETTVTEKLAYVPGARRQPTPTQVQMFIDKGDDILLPYDYAKKMGFDHRQSQKDKWLQVIYNREPNFVGVMRDYQVDILNEAIEYLVKSGCVVISTECASGKTFMASKLWWEIELLGCVITNRKEVHKSWVTTFRKTCPDCVIWIPGTPFPDRMPHIIVSMDGQIDKIPEEIRLSVGTLILDEVHMLCTQTRNKMFLAFEPKFVIVESATLEMNNGMERMCNLVAGYEGIFRISKKPYNIYVVKTNIFGNQEYGKSGLISASLQKSLVENQDRQNIIIQIIMNNYHRKFICLQRVITGIEDLTDKLRGYGIPTDSLYGHKKGYSNSKVLLGTMSRVAVGFDEENACADFYLNPEKSNTLILINSIKSWQLFAQSCGRVGRSENPCIIWLMDDNPNVASHLNSLKPWIAKTNGTLVYVNDFRQLFIP